MVETALRQPGADNASRGAHDDSSKLFDLVALLRSNGFDVRDERVAPRPRPFTPVGVLVHHTGTGGDQDLPTLQVVKQGRPDLVGPLCQILLGRQGTVAAICDGHANHAGRGRSGVLTQVENGHDIQPGHAPDDADGNQWFYGIEIENDGAGQRYPDVQYRAAVALAACLCRHFHWTHRAVLGHKEWTGRKSDPSFDMTAFRSAVAAELGDTDDLPTV